VAQEHPITRLGGWAGYEVVEDWQERRGGKSWCVLRLEAVTGWLRQCSHCGESTRAVHDQQERRIRELPIFEYRVELVVPRVRVACARCGPRLERLSWLEPYARLTRRLGESVAQLCRVASIRHVASFFGLDWKTVKDLVTSPRKPDSFELEVGRFLWLSRPHCGELARGQVAE